MDLQFLDAPFAGAQAILGIPFEQRSQKRLSFGTEKLRHAQLSPERTLVCIIDFLANLVTANGQGVQSVAIWETISQDLCQSKLGRHNASELRGQTG